MKKLLTILTLLLTVNGHSASWFVTPSGAGGNTGVDWSDAWAGGSIPWGSVSVGDVVYLAGGSYSSRFHIQASGTAVSPITIRRVVSTDSAATSAAGWSSAFDSTVNFTVSNSFGADFDAGSGVSYVTLDGRMDGGIKFLCADGQTAICLSNKVSFCTLTNLEIVGPGTPNTNGYPFNNDTPGIYFYPATGGNPTFNSNVFTHCRIHGVVDAILMQDANGTLVVHCLIYDIWAKSNGVSQQHDNVCECLNTTNCTFRYCQVWNWATEGIMFSPLIGLLSSNWWIYNNVWHDPSGGPGSQTGRVIESQYVANGPVHFFNNTIANGWIVSNTGNGGSWAGGGVCQASNNIVWNCNPATTVNLPVEDYTLSSASAAGAHSISYAAYPFSHTQGGWPNVSTNDLHILGTTGSLFPAGNGFNLGAPFNMDIDGNTQTPPWSIGAYVSPGAPAPMINSVSITINGQQQIITQGNIVITIH